MPPTGPRTDDGKRRSSQNARTHGLTARTPVVEGEDAAAYAAFLSGVVASLQPEGALEDALAERAAACLWRVQRAPRIEAALLRPEPAPAPDTMLAMLAQANGQTLPEPPAPDVRVYAVHADELERVARYETHAERAAYRALAELRHAQAHRRALNPTPRNCETNPASA